MKSSCSDPYDIKRFELVVGESYMMVPDSTKRLQQALEDLSSFMLEHSDDANESALNQAGEWFPTAERLLRENYRTTTGGQNDADVVPETSIEGLAEGENF
jgi:hypothetical protein